MTEAAEQQVCANCGEPLEAVPYHGSEVYYLTLCGCGMKYNQREEKEHGETNTVSTR